MKDTSYNEPTAKLLETTTSRGTVAYASIGVGIVLILLAVALVVFCLSGQHKTPEGNNSKGYVGWIGIGILFLVGIPVLLFLILGGQKNLHLKRWRATISSHYPYESYIRKTLDGRLDINDVLLFIGYGLIFIGIASVIGVSIYVLAKGKNQTTIAVFVSIVLGFLIIGIIMYTTNPTLFNGFISGVFHKNAKNVAETESDSSCTSTK